MKKLYALLFKIVLTAGLILGLNIHTQAQAICTLGKGDLIITGYDTNDDQNDGSTKDDRFSFILMKDVAAGQVICFTDLGWVSSNNSFQDPSKAVSDGVIKWTTDKVYPAGTEIVMYCKFTLKATLKDGTTPAGTVSSVLESYNTRVSNPTDPKEYMSLGDFEGDQIFAFIAPLIGSNDYTTGITFLAALSANVSSGGWASTLSYTLQDASLSELPVTITSGAQNVVISYNDGDDADGFTNDAFAARYNKISGTASAILASANTSASWTKSPDVPDALFVPFASQAAFTITGPILSTVADRLNICPGTATSFTSTVTEGCSYQWQIQPSGGPFTNLTNVGVFSNVTTNTLNISNVNGFGGFKFRLIVRGSTIATSNEASLTVVNQTIVLTPATLAAGNKGVVYADQTIGITSGGAAPYTFSISAGALPNGLTIAGATGIISGTPTVAGTFNFTVQATSSCSSIGTRAYSITVKEILLSPATLTSPTIGVAYSAALSASGGTAPYTYSVVSGALPAGLTLSSDGTISGTVTNGGTFSFNIRATDASGSPGPYFGTQGYSFTTTAPAIVFSPATIPNPTVGSSYNQTLTASAGTAPYTYAITAGALPAGLTLSTGGILSGTPTEGGTFNFTVRATDATTGTGPYNGSRSYSISVLAPTIILSPASLPPATVATAYTQTVTASGGTAPYSYYIVAGALPAGLSLSSTGILTGTPTAGGPFNFIIRAFDSSTGTGAPFSASTAYTLTVNAPTITVSPATLSAGTIGVLYNQAITASGGIGSYTYALTSGALPAGLSLSASGTLSGTATSSGSFTFTITATDSSTGSGPYTGSRAYTLTIGAPTLSIAPASLPAGTVGSTYAQVVTASGGTAPYTYSIASGALPDGLTLSSTGTLAGTPTAGGSFTFSIQAMDSSTGTGAPFTATRSYTLNIAAPTIVLAPPSLVSGTVGVSYSQSVSASGGTAPYSYAVTAGALPAGLNLSSGGTLSGTPAAGGPFNFTITATDASTGGTTYTGSRAYILTIAAPVIAISPSTLPNGTVAQNYSQTITASGGTAPYVYAVTTGSLPAGLTLSTAGVLSGTPTAGGTLNFTVTATDASGGNGPYSSIKNYSLNIVAPTLAISPASLPDATQGSAYSQTIATSGGTAPYAYAITAGALPSGLSLSTSGVLSGTATVSGSFTFTVRSTDASTGSGPYNTTTTYTLNVIFAPKIVSASYDAATGLLSVTGINFPPVGTTVVVNNLTIKANGFSYSLTSANVTSGNNAFSISLNGADVLSNMLNRNGTTGPDGNTYTLTAAAGFFTGAPADATGGTITVSNVLVPTINTATYNVSSGVLTVSGTGFRSYPGATNDVVVSKIAIATASGTYPLSSNAVEVTSATSFSLTLNAADRAFLKPLINKNGTTSTEGVLYNLAAAEDWLQAADPAANITDAVSGLTVNNVGVPAITGATYDAATGTLAVSGLNLLSLDGLANDIIASKFAITGEGNTVYTLTTTPDVDISSTTSFNLILSAVDKKAVNMILNQNSTVSTGGTTYNLAAGEDWANGADAAVVIADLSNNGINVSNVAVPAITASTYDVASGALVVTGTGFLKLSGASNDIVSNKFTFTGQAGGTYTLTNTPNAELSSDTEFTINLSATDMAILKVLLNKDGLQARSGTIYNLAAAEDWAAGAAPAVVVADLINPINVSHALSANADLSALSTTANGFSPTFTAGTTAYQASVSTTTGSITVTATRADILSAMQVNINGGTYSVLTDNTPSNPLALLFGNNNINVKVTAEDGTVKTYTITVNRPNAGQSITFNPTNSVAYGTADYDPAASSATSGINTITYSSNDASVATIVNNQIHVTGVGTTTITASQAGSYGLDPAPNVTQTLTVVQGVASISLSNLAQTYDGTAKSVTATTNPAGLSGVSLTYNGSATLPVAAGTYTVVASLTNTNYTSPGATANLIITPKNITVSANAAAKVYGNADPALTYTTAPGALAGTDAFTGSLSRTSGNNVGTYAITQGSLTAGSNYNISFNSANFSITAKPITVTANAGQSKVYGSADPVFTYTSSVLVSGDAFTGALSRAAGEHVGTYAIGQGTLTAGSNYTIGYTGANFSITPKALTVTADNKTRVQGTANPAFTATYTGFANGDTNAALLTQPVFATTATPASLQGTYPIVVNGATSNNYAITFVNGTLTVTPGTPTSLTIAAATLFENRPAGTLAGTLSSTSDDPGASFTYTLVPGTGSTDNAAFSISGNQLVTAQSFDFETKNSYSVRVRTTTQYGLFLEQTFTVNVLDVNEAPTLNTIADAALCTTSATQSIALTGISAGPETAQSTVLSVTSNNAALFNSLSVSGTGSTGTLSYQIKPGVSGVATITVTVQDNGGTANDGTDTFTRTFNLTIYALPTPSIASDKGDQVSKGETIKLTATGGTGYVWANANGIISGQNTATLTVRPSVTTTYTVTATNANGCSQSSSFTITVLSDFAKLKITNLLTPNGDGYNDKWTVENIDLYPNNEVKVFDKAGKLVYSKKGYDNSWDGSFNGSPLAENTYYYIIDFGPNYGKLKGFVTIVRE